jgi:hypothetical protein
MFSSTYICFLHSIKALTQPSSNFSNRIELIDTKNYHFSNQKWCGQLSFSTLKSGNLSLSLSLSLSHTHTHTHTHTHYRLRNNKKELCITKLNCNKLRDQMGIIWKVWRLNWTFLENFTTDFSVFSIVVLPSFNPILVQ